jgi:hypothetical protein
MSLKASWVSRLVSNQLVKIKELIIKIFPKIVEFLFVYKCNTCLHNLLYRVSVVN